MVLLVTLHPRPPSAGVRATAPDGLWHVDTTVLRLLDGAPVYLRAVIDNFSRRILAQLRTHSFCINPSGRPDALVQKVFIRSRAVFFLR
jgi:transposase InsO family protein